MPKNSKSFKRAHVTAKITNAWSSVDSGLVAHSFKCCSISLTRDGSENDQIFDYDHLFDPNNNNAADEGFRRQENIFENDDLGFNEELNYNEKPEYDVK
ncbi:20955_t:CDS:2 [Cetraspora pellucida]|uniref:20955_t:CDS:1 n=1 Tax=Cetraspora pellucida TaxID=1433469 RepID=A0A9N9P736_9GLOM|nr:20955_t:CDS:2 [Cetraspora pellucida]